LTGEQNSSNSEYDEASHGVLDPERDKPVGRSRKRRVEWKACRGHRIRLVSAAKSIRHPMCLGPLSELLHDSTARSAWAEVFHNGLFSSPLVVNEIPDGPNPSISNLSG
jgi:hypothetical protein